jgi:hypothetical protein
MTNFITDTTNNYYNKNENLRVYRLGTVCGKTIWTFKPGSRSSVKYLSVYMTISGG